MTHDNELPEEIYVSKNVAKVLAALPASDTIKYTRTPPPPSCDAVRLAALKTIEQSLQHYADRFRGTRGSQLHANMGLAALDKLRALPATPVNMATLPDCDALNTLKNMGGEAVLKEAAEKYAKLRATPVNPPVTPEEAAEALEDFTDNLSLAMIFPENDRITNLKVTTSFIIRRLLENAKGGG